MRTILIGNIEVILKEDKVFVYFDNKPEVLNLPNIEYEEDEDAEDIIRYELELLQRTFFDNNSASFFK